MPESELLTRDDCRRVFELAVQAAGSLGAPDIEVSLSAVESALTRFANNAIHQNVAERRGQFSVRAVAGQRTARAITNRFDEAAIRSVVEQAVTLTRAQAPDPEVLPLAEPAGIPEVARFFPATARSSPAERAAAVAEAIAVAEAASQTAAGIYSASQSAEALLNSRGLFAYYRETLAQFSITTMAEDSSGWAKAGSPDVSRISPLELARRASQKAARAGSPRELPSGRYTVILEPSAVQDLLGQLFWDFSATALEDQRSFLNGRLGEKLFGANVTISDDVCHPLQNGPPFDGEGAPVNIVMEGGATTLEEMIASTERGILVTRLWYIREVDPYQKIMTGMTRDGTFLIEDGRLACGLRNFRFNQSLIELLSNIEALSPALRASGEESFEMVVPALKVRDFNFTEVTRF